MYAKEVSILQRASKGRFVEMTRVLADEGVKMLDSSGISVPP